MRRERIWDLLALRHVLCIVFCVLALLASAGEPVFIQRSAQIPDQTKISGWRRHLVNVKTGHFMFEAPAGSKIHAVFSAQQLTIDCGKIEGNWLGDPRNAQLENATMTGGVRAELSRHSQNPSSSQLQSTVVTGDTATFTNVGYALHVVGGVHVVTSDPGAEQSLDLTGSSADIELSKPHTSTRAVQSATINGPVKFEMHGMRTEASNAPKRVPFTINGVADRATFNDAARTITLIGHVHVTADDPAMGGDQDVDKETIHLAEDGSVDYVEGEGNPGTTVIRQKGTGGKG